MDISVYHAFQLFIDKLKKLFKNELVSKSVAAFAVKIIAAAAMFVLNVILARKLGANDIGIFFLSVTIVTLVAVVSRLGLDNAVLKYISAYTSKNKHNRVSDVYFKANALVFLMSLILVFLFISNISIVNQYLFDGDISVNDSLYLFVLSVIPVALITIQSESLKGLKRITESVSIQSLLVPVFTIFLTLLFVDQYGLYGAALSYLLGNFITLVIALYIWNVHKVRSFNKIETDKVEINQLLKVSMPMLWVAIFQVVNIWFSTLALGVLATNEDVGIYNLAARTAALTSFILVAVNSISAPKFSEMYENNDSEGLERVAKGSALIATVMATPVLCAFIIMPEYVMSIFGSEFKNGAIVLSILAISQFINVCTGSVGYLLLMSGNEKKMRNNMFFCTAINIVLNILLIPELGIIGAALATASVMVLQNVIAVIIAWRSLNIITLPINFSRYRTTG